MSPLFLNFETPIRINDSFPIRITDTNLAPIEGLTVTITPTQEKQVAIGFPWEENTNYKIILPQYALRDSLSNFLTKADTIRFKTKKKKVMALL